MRLAIEQSLRFEYTRPVFLEPMIVRLTPVTNAAQTCEEASLVVDPQPAGMTLFTDAGGHPAHQLWFAGSHAALFIRARSVVRTHLENPFDFILTDPATRQLPMTYPPDLALALHAERLMPAPDAALDALVAQFRDASQNQTLQFLAALCGHLHDHLRYGTRAEGDPWPAAETLAAGWGSCRDLAVLFIDACRRVGLAARFVSGYALDSEEAAATAELHAWAEVFLPGGGWRGYDPALGLLTSDQHVVLSAGHVSQLAAPTYGLFRGTKVQSSLSATTEMHRLDAPAAALPSPR